MARFLFPLRAWFAVSLGLASFACRAQESKPAAGTASPAAVATTADHAGPSAVWVAEKDGKRIYLGGTIHLLRDTDYPLPAVFEEAYQDSTKIVLELPPGSDSDGAIVLRMREMGVYPTGTTLADTLKPENYSKVKKWAESRNLPLSVLNPMRPWFLSLTVAATEYQALGADASRGVDHYFETKAKSDGKPAEALETVEQQLALFTSLSDALQEELLDQTFAEVETMASEFDELIGAWRRGDAEALYGLLFEESEKHAELLEKFLLKRNRTWIEPLMKYLQKGERVFVLVGAGHLGGKGGVLELLTKEGCTVRQLQK